MWNNPGGFDGDFSGTTGGGSGGGFMNTTAQFGSPAAKKERRSQNIIATTVKCILDCQEESFTIEGMEVNMVCLVGIIRSVDISSTKISYTLDDHTGVIDVLRYPEGDAEETNENDALAEGVYARVFGPVRSLQEKRHILGFRVVQVDDPNMITTHVLEVIQQQLMLKKLKSSGAGEGSGPVLANSSLLSGPSVPGGSGNSDKDLVYRVIVQGSSSESGISKAAVKASLQRKLAADKIDRLMEELASDGSIYTTVDDEHFMAIEST
ncbi:Replication protein A C-terminal [Trinorchestia longiramus]|nr:Replication protein A C-terminal [Trinorchestia longiramus]